MESKITFHCDSLLLEGQINPLSKTSGVVITHPHPLYGGDLANPVVETIARAYAGKGITTLRFNFRGVGQSQGVFADGIGEQEDVLAAVSILKKSGIKDIHLAGYSFGAWVNGHIRNLPSEVSNLVMVAPPVAFMDYNDAPAQSLLRLVVAGENDEIAPPALIERYLPDWNQKARLVVIDHADHFFFGNFNRLKEVLTEYI